MFFPALISRFAMEKVGKLINFPEKIIQDIEEYQEENDIASFTAAVLELIRKGLNTGRPSGDSSPD